MQSLLWHHSRGSQDESERLSGAGRRGLELLCAQGLEPAEITLVAPDGDCSKGMVILVNLPRC